MLNLPAKCCTHVQELSCTTFCVCRTKCIIVHVHVLFITMINRFFLSNKISIIFLLCDHLGLIIDSQLVIQTPDHFMMLVEREKSQATVTTFENRSTDSKLIHIVV